VRVLQATASTTVTSSLGTFWLEASQDGLRRVRLPGEGDTEATGGTGRAAGIAAAATQQVAAYLDGDRREFEVELDWADVDAEHRHVLEVLREIAPFGRTVTYGELGRSAGVPDPRDVGVHMGRNPLPLVIPCHRVLAADGLGGYGGGLELKRRLLALEGALPLQLELGGA
jgi:methylated-DNA-[protein]-cysteine S-methyltransferase